MSDAKMEIIMTAKDMTARTFTVFQNRVRAITSSVFSMNSAIGLLAGGAGIGLLLDKLNRATDKASDFQETLSKVNTIFGDSVTARIRNWAEDAEKAMGMTTRSALESVGTMGNMFKQLGATADQSAVLSQRMVSLSADIASFHNVSGGANEVMDAMQAAFRGEYDALQRYIPTINAAAVAEQALSDTHKERTSELNDLEKALAAQKIILRDAGDATGDFAKTSDGLANQERILAARVDELQEKIGRDLLPVKTKVVMKLNEWIDANEGLLSQKISNYIDGIGKSLSNIIDTYNKVPSDIVGAAGYGIVGRMLFGTQVGQLVAALVYTNSFLEKFNLNLGSIGDSYNEFAEAYQNMLDVITGKKDFNTGYLKDYGQASETAFRGMEMASYGGAAGYDFNIAPPPGGGGGGEAFPELDNKYWKEYREMEIADAKAYDDDLIAGMAETNAAYNEMLLAKKQNIEEYHAWEFHAFGEQADRIIAIENEKAAAQIAAAQTAVSNVGKALELAGRQNEFAFKAYQAFQIAEAVITGYAAAVKAWDAGMSTGGPQAPAVAAAYAAASLAWTGAQIAAIGGASFGATGAGTYSSPMVTTDVSSSAYSTASEEEKRGTVNIYIEGNVIGDEDHIIDLAERLSEMVEDRDVRLVASNAKIADIVA